MLSSKIGIDVGATSVRAVQVRRGRGNRFRIVRAAEVPLERGVVVGGDVARFDDLALAVRDLWKIGKFRSRDVAIGMAGNQTFVRQVDLPWEQEELFRESLPLRVSQDLPVEASEMTLDFYPLNQYDRGRVPMQRALLVAATNAAVENTAGAVSAGRLRVGRADYSPFALIRAAVAVAGDGTPVPGPPAPGEERECEVIVDIGAQLTTIAIHDHGRPLFVRVVSAGSESVTRALSDHLRIRFDEANMIKQSLGLQSVGGAEPGFRPDATLLLPPQTVPVAQQILNVMAGSLVQVARESVEYFLAASPDIGHVSRVLLSGGGALLPGYPERISSELRAPAEILAPLSRYASGSAKGSTALDPRMNIALGLALEVK